MIGLLLFMFSSLAIAQPEVQISSKRDAKGKFINETVLAVDWEMETDNTTFKEYQEADVPDHSSEDDDSFQEWFVEKKANTGIYWKFTFTRDIKGEYAVRWRPESTSFWSDWSSCTTTKVKPPKHSD